MSSLSLNPLKIRVYTLQNWLHLTFAVLMQKPLNWIAVFLEIVAPVNTVTKWHDIFCHICSAFAERYPVILCQRMPQPTRSITYSTAMPKILQTALPILLRKCGWQKRFFGLTAACLYAYSFGMPFGKSSLVPMNPIPIVTSPSVVIGPDFRRVFRTTQLCCRQFFWHTPPITRPLFCEMCVAIFPTIPAIFFRIGFAIIAHVGIVARFTNARYAIRTALTLHKISDGFFQFALGTAFYRGVNHSILTNALSQDGCSQSGVSAAFSPRRARLQLYFTTYGGA